MINMFTALLRRAETSEQIATSNIDRDVTEEIL